jgi:vacuolar iron transporter family protein
MFDGVRISTLISVTALMQALDVLTLVIHPPAECGRGGRERPRPITIVGSMPSTPHVETHFEASATVRDVVIGMSDGLTVPFALAAGLTGTVAATSKLVVIAGLAEIAAGSIAMGLGGYLAARTDREHYEHELAREYRETVELPDKEREEVADVFRGYGMTEQQLAPVVDAIVSDQKRWVDFMMRFELGFEQPDPKRARNSAATIAASYIVGGLVPLSSYMVLSDLNTALYSSAAVTLMALFLFGYFKGRLTGISPLIGGFQTVLIGGLASAAAFGLARWIS